MQQGVATAAGVDKSLVTIRVTAASVRITASIAVPAATTAVAVQESLSSTLGNATSASAALGITVESEPTIHILMDSTDDVAVAAIAGGSAGGVLACIFVVLVGVAGRASYIKRQAAKALIKIEKARAPATKPVHVVMHTSPWGTSGDTGTARALEVPTLPAAAKVSVPVPQNIDIAAALVACGLEHRVRTFEDDGYTLDKARTALSAGEKVLMADLRERKLLLGECRRMINHLQATDTSVAGSSEEMPGDKDTDNPECGGGALSTEGLSQVKVTEEWLGAAAAKQAAAAKAAEEKAAAAAAKKSAATEAVAKKASSEQAAVNELFAGRQVTVWLTESCEINASDAKLYADALAQLGVDRPADLQMIDGDEVVWPSAVKLLDREKIQARLETDAESPQNIDIAAALVACGLEHRVRTFEDDGYTLDKARTALSAGEKVLMADLRERKLPLGECRKLINQLQGTDYDTSVAGSSPMVGNQVIMWLTEICDINASDAKLYADAFAELGIDTPEDLHMIDGDEVAWPSVVKPVHRKKIKAGLESSRKTPVGRKMSDTI